MARCTTDDLKEILAYYRIQSEDRAQEAWKKKLEEIHGKKSRTK